MIGEAFHFALASSEALGGEMTARTLDGESISENGAKHSPKNQSFLDKVKDFFAD